MPHTREQTVWCFDELSERAKERAREWFRQGALDRGWWKFVYDDAARCGEILGIDLRRKPVRLMNGSTRYDPAIWFTGFYSQGDGACFEGSYTYAKGCARAIRRHAPCDLDLHKIADQLVALQRAWGYRLVAQTSHRGYYCHSGCMDVDVSAREGRDPTYEAEQDLTDILRSFADWIYRQLEREHDWQLADEQVDEAIRSNEYEFTEEGERARMG